MPDRLLSDHPMHVAPVFVGRRVASPIRRMVAFGIDAALLIVPTIIAAVLIVAASMYVRERPAFDALRTLKRGEAKTEAQQQAVLAALLPMLVRAEARGIPHEVDGLLDDSKNLEAAELIKDFNIELNLDFGEGESVGPVKPKTIVLPVAKLIPGAARGIALFMVPALYFTVLTRTKRGATIGKRLAGILVVRLDGHHLSWLESFERFVGYLHIPATLFIGLIDLWHDPNRRMGHDRAAHTAVLRRQ